MNPTEPKESAGRYLDNPPIGSKRYYRCLETGIVGYSITPEEPFTDAKKNIRLRLNLGDGGFHNCSKYVPVLQDEFDRFGCGEK